MFTINERFKQTLHKKESPDTQGNIRKGRDLHQGNIGKHRHFPCAGSQHSQPFQETRLYHGTEAQKQETNLS